MSKRMFTVWVEIVCMGCADIVAETHCLTRTIPRQAMSRAAEACRWQYFTDHPETGLEGWYCPKCKDRGQREHW